MTIDQIKRALQLAERLGFRDDVEHWKNELKKLEEKK